MIPIQRGNPPSQYALAQKTAAETKKEMAGTKILFLETFEGRIVIVNAAIRAALQMIEPTAFPYAISPCPMTADVEETITSGKVVPIDTIVAPITISDIRILRARPVAASTNQLPPKIRHANPKRNNKTVQNVMILNG